MDMKKTILMVLISLILAGTLSAGGNKEASVTSGDNGAPAATIQKLTPGADGFILLPAGTFDIGPDSMPGVPGYNDMERMPKITLDSFRMAEYQVMQKEYQSIMGTNPSIVKNGDYPVDNVSWFDAVEFCNRLSQRDGLTPAYIVKGTDVTWNHDANGYRLPTEAEWEYAATAGKTAFPDSEHPWGLKAMPGEIWEWCWDWYAVYPKEAQVNPAGPDSGAKRIMRAGTFGMCSPRGSLVRLRSNNNPSSAGNSISFRIVRS